MRASLLAASNDLFFIITALLAFLCSFQALAGTKKHAVINGNAKALQQVLMLAIKRADLWSAVLLSSVAFNVPYGPWNGSSWFHKMSEAAQDFAMRPPAGCLLFDLFYQRICAYKRFCTIGLGGA